MTILDDNHTLILVIPWATFDLFSSCTYRWGVELCPSPDSIMTNEDEQSIIRQCPLTTIQFPLFPAGPSRADLHQALGESRPTLIVRKIRNLVKLWWFSSTSLGSNFHRPLSVV